MKKGKHLDEEIKKALENLEVNFDPKSWMAFEERLNAAHPVDDHLLDNLVKERLSNLEAPFQSDDWATMERLIEADEAAELIENEAFIDNLAYEKLHRLEVPFHHPHWHLMAKRLEEEFSLRHKLYRYKVAELALMALILLTIIRFAPLAENLLQHPEKENRNAAPHYLPLPIQPSFEQNAPVLPPAASDQVAPQAVPATPIAAATPRHLHKVNPSGNLKKTAKELMTYSYHGRGETPAAGDARTGGAIASLPYLAPSDLYSLKRPSSFFDSLKERAFLNNSVTTPGMRIFEGPDQLLASLQPAPVQSKYAWEVPQVPQKLLEKESELRLSLFTATDISYVTTPSNRFSVFDTLVPTNPNSTWASSYGGGILISWKKDRLELQTGGIYSFKRYVPDTPAFSFETMFAHVGEEFNGTQLDLLQVPLQVQYHFKNSGKWRLYGNGGVSTHLIASSVYKIKNEGTPVYKLAVIPSPEGDAPEQNSGNIRHEREYLKGLFEGGELRSNVYLSANIGLGVERFVSQRWSLFFQPNYQHYLTSEGVGFNKDKFYTFTINLGTKVNLK